MRKVFFDTWAWIALANGKDKHHQEALDFYKTFLQEKGLAITTDYVMAETFSALKKAVSIEPAISFGHALFGNIKNEKIQLIFINEERFSKTWFLYEKYRDKTEISFFDLSSMVVMEEMGIKEIFTGDSDFKKVGMGFILLP